MCRIPTISRYFRLGLMLIPYYIYSAPRGGISDLCDYNFDANIRCLVEICKYFGGKFKEMSKKVDFEKEKGKK